MMAQAEDDDDDESESVRAWLLRDTGPGVSQDYLSWQLGLMSQCCVTPGCLDAMVPCL